MTKVKPQPFRLYPYPKAGDVNRYLERYPFPELFNKVGSDITDVIVYNNGAVWAYSHETSNRQYVGRIYNAATSFVPSSNKITKQIQTNIQKHTDKIKLLQTLSNEYKLIFVRKEIE